MRPAAEGETGSTCAAVSSCPASCRCTFFAMLDTQPPCLLLVVHSWLAVLPTQPRQHPTCMGMSCCLWHTSLAGSLLGLVIPVCASVSSVPCELRCTFLGMLTVSCASCCDICSGSWRPRPAVQRMLDARETHCYQTTSALKHAYGNLCHASPCSGSGSLSASCVGTSTCPVSHVATALPRPASAPLPHRKNTRTPPVTTDKYRKQGTHGTLRGQLPRLCHTTVVEAHEVHQAEKGAWRPKGSSRDQMNSVAAKWVAVQRGTPHHCTRSNFDSVGVRELEVGGRG